MKYFLTEAERKITGSSCFYEFQRGRFDNDNYTFWKSDSINVSDDTLFMLGIDVIILEVIPHYDPFGETVVSREQWRTIMERAEQLGGELLVAMSEADKWAQDTFTTYDEFTIVGI